MKISIAIYIFANNIEEERLVGSHISGVYATNNS